MSVVDYVRRWLELNAWFFRKLARFADVVAGICFVLMVPLAIVVFQQLHGITIPLSEDSLRLAYYAFLAVGGVFVLAVLVQTLSALRAFFARVWLRVVDVLS